MGAIQWNDQDITIKRIRAVGATQLNAQDNTLQGSRAVEAHQPTPKHSPIP